MSPLSSVRGKLALALLLVVAGVLAIVYLIVVPSYQTSLENTELKGLQASLQKVALPHFPAESYLQQQFVDTVAQSDERPGGRLLPDERDPHPGRGIR